MRLRALVASATVLVVLAGCSFSASTGDDGISGSKLADRVSPIIEEEIGQAPDELTCEDLEAEVDATTPCTMTLDGDSLALKVTVTSVDGSDVKFDVEVDQDDAASTTTEAEATDEITEPEPTETTEGQGVGAVVAADELEARINAGLEAEVGRVPEDVTCDEPLDGIVGNTGTCVLTDGGESYEVTVTVQAVDGLDVNFDFQVGTEPLP